MGGRRPAPHRQVGLERRQDRPAAQRPARPAHGVPRQHPSALALQPPRRDRLRVGRRRHARLGLQRRLRLDVARERLRRLLPGRRPDHDVVHDRRLARRRARRGARHAPLDPRARRPDPGGADGPDGVPPPDPRARTRPRRRPSSRGRSRPTRPRRPSSSARRRCSRSTRRPAPRRRRPPGGPTRSTSDAGPPPRPPPTRAGWAAWTTTPPAFFRPRRPCPSMTTLHAPPGVPVLIAGLLVVGLFAAGCADGPADRSASGRAPRRVRRARAGPTVRAAGGPRRGLLARPAVRPDGRLPRRRRGVPGRAPTGATSPGRRGACVDVHQAYVADARSGPRDLDGRLGAVQAGRAFGLAYSAVVAERSRRTAESMTADPPPPRPMTHTLRLLTALVVLATTATAQTPPEGPPSEGPAPRGPSSPRSCPASRSRPSRGRLARRSRSRPAARSRSPCPAPTGSRSATGSRRGPSS